MSGATKLTQQFGSRDHQGHEGDEQTVHASLWLKRHLLEPSLQVRLSLSACVQLFLCHASPPSCSSCSEEKQ